MNYQSSNDRALSTVVALIARFDVKCNLLNIQNDLTINSEIWYTISSDFKGCVLPDKRMYFKLRKDQRRSRGLSPWLLLLLIR